MSRPAEEIAERMGNDVIVGYDGKPRRDSRRPRGPAKAAKRARRSVADLRTSTPRAEKFGKQLKSQGYRFVGPTSVYAFMQNVGVVNDHIHGGFRATDSIEPPTD